MERTEGVGPSYTDWRPVGLPLSYVLKREVKGLEPLLLFVRRHSCHDFPKLVGEEGFEPTRLLGGSF